MSDARNPYQVLPPLAEEEFAALKADIAAHGVLVPIECDEQGAVLDGHHRLAAWEELRAAGIEVPLYPRTVRTGFSEAEKLAHVLALNLTRRHLDKETRAALLRRLRDETGWSNPKIATETGFSISTVRRDLISTCSPEQDNRDARVIDQNGFSRPAHVPKQFICDTCGEIFTGVAVWECGRCHEHSALDREACANCEAPRPKDGTIVGWDGDSDREWGDLRDAVRAGDPLPTDADSPANGPSVDERAHADMTIVDLLQAGVALPPFPQLAEEVTAFNQVVYAARVARMDPHAVAREVGPRGQIQCDGLIRLARWLERLVLALGAQPTLRAVTRDANDSGLEQED